MQKNFAQIRVHKRRPIALLQIFRCLDFPRFYITHDFVHGFILRIVILVFKLQQI